MNFRFLNNNTFRLFSIILTLYLLLVSLGYIYINKTLISDSKDFITQIEEKIGNSLSFEDGKWDTSLYNSDPHLPYPNASTTFPVYILTRDGYVIERSRPIKDVLDSSDYKHLMQFQEPTSINSIVNESWRVLSLPLKEGSEELGVILVAYFNPNEEYLTSIDEKLERNLTIIKDQINLVDGEIDLSEFDERKADYDISFEIVSRSNKILHINGRTPSFIDPSYVDDEIKNKNIFRTVFDTNSNESFLIKSITMTDSDNKAVGVIVVGRSISFVDRIAWNYLSWSLCLALLLIPFLFIVVNSYIKKEVNLRLNQALTNQDKFVPQKSLSFDKKNSLLKVDSKDFPINYASNQYYLCLTVFKNINKRWEYDEISEMIGESFDITNHKKIYDAAIAINKKVGFKLIHYADKTFMINPDYKNLVNQK